MDVAREKFVPPSLFDLIPLPAANPTASEAASGFADLLRPPAPLVPPLNPPTSQAPTRPDRPAPMLETTPRKNESSRSPADPQESSPLPLASVSQESESAEQEIAAKAPSAETTSTADKTTDEDAEQDTIVVTEAATLASQTIALKTTPLTDGSPSFKGVNADEVNAEGDTVISEAKPTAAVPAQSDATALEAEPKSTPIMEVLPVQTAAPTNTDTLPIVSDAFPTPLNDEKTEPPNLVIADGAELESDDTAIKTPILAKQTQVVAQVKSTEHAITGRSTTITENRSSEPVSPETAVTQVNPTEVISHVTPKLIVDDGKREKSDSPASQSEAESTATPEQSEQSEPVPALEPSATLPPPMEFSTPLPAYATQRSSESTENPTLNVGGVARQHSTLFKGAAERANAETKATEIDPAKFLPRIVKAFQVAQQREGEVRLRLHPPELGAVRIDIQVQDGTLTARVQAETNEARAAILDNLPALRERLAEQGVRIEKFDVDLFDPSSGQPNQSGGDTPRDARPGSSSRGASSTHPQILPIDGADEISRPLSSDPQRLNVII